MICDRFTIISYMTNNNVNLLWIAWAIVFKCNSVLKKCEKCDKPSTITNIGIAYQKLAA